MSVERGQAITVAHLNNLATKANDKLPAASPAYGFNGDGTGAGGGGWLSELNRIRLGLQDFLTTGSGVAMKEMIQLHRHFVSGPYIISTEPSIFDFRKGKDLCFIFPADQAPATVVFTSYHHQNSNNPPTFENTTDTFQDTLSATWKFRIGGDKNVHLYSSPLVARITNVLYPDATTSPPPPTATVETNIPGLQWDLVPAWIPTGNEYGYFECSMDQHDVPPGDYHLTVTLGPGEWRLRWGELYGQELRVSIETTEASPTAGIHSTQQVLEIAAPLTDDEAFGIWIDNRSVPQWGWQAGWLAVSTNKGGFWRCKTYPIANIPVNLWDKMPTNPVGETILQRRAAPDPLVDPVKKAVTPAMNYQPAAYPVLRDTDAVPTWWHAWNPFGMFIHRVTIRRRPEDQGHGILLPQPGRPALTVELGCMRNGVFSAFDSVIIPNGANEVDKQVCWPVFTATPLRYRCTEACTVHAIPAYMLSAFLGYTTWQEMAAANYSLPVFAAFHNDMEAVLDQL